jgi:hypothetical protein
VAGAGRWVASADWWMTGAGKWVAGADRWVEGAGRWVAGRWPETGDWLLLDEPDSE